MKKILLLTMAALLVSCGPSVSSLCKKQLKAQEMVVEALMSDDSPRDKQEAIQDATDMMRDLASDAKDVKAEAWDLAKAVASLVNDEHAQYVEAAYDHYRYRYAIKDDDLRKALEKFSEAESEYQKELRKSCRVR